MLQLYGSRLEGWGTVTLGSGGTSAIDIVNTDFLDNTAIEFRSTGLKAEAIRMHFTTGNEAVVGGVYNIPTLLKGLQVFKTTEGLRFEVSTDVEEYLAGDNTNDLVIQEGDTVNLLNSVFDESTFLRVL